MGKRNIIFNDYISQNERFADFFNGVIFKGKQIIRSEDLTTLDTKLWRRKDEKDSYHEFVRDHVKLWKCEDCRFVLGIEPEESLHFALPVKYMNYESIQYDRELKNRMKEHRRSKDLAREEYVCGFSREDELVPVVTFGVYLGDKPWTAPRNLKDILKIKMLSDFIQEELLIYCNDFHANVIDVNLLENTDIFVTDLREVFGFLQRKNDWDGMCAKMKNSGIYEKMPIVYCLFIAIAVN